MVLITEPNLGQLTDLLLQYGQRVSCVIFPKTSAGWCFASEIGNVLVPGGRTLEVHYIPRPINGNTPDKVATSWLTEIDSAAATLIGSGEFTKERIVIVLLPADSRDLTRAVLEQLSPLHHKFAARVRHDSPLETPLWLAASNSQIRPGHLSYLEVDPTPAVTATAA